MTRFRAIAFALLLGIASIATLAWAQPDAALQGQDAAPETARRETPSPNRSEQLGPLLQAIQRLPVAAGLAVILALRPRRRGTPPRQAPVVQTQIILAIVGAVVMLVVGTSLARAFGIVGAAGLVRYRAKIQDPKDAGVMLSTLAIGLASGVGLWMLAAFATAFVLAVLWIVESFEPQARQLFTLAVTLKDSQAFRPKLESLLGSQRLQFELRSEAPESLTYEVRMPLEKKVDRLSNAILGLDPNNATGVEWEEKKEKT
jgi:uncharacterized membrane protein YhiD involved in acid resistance